jgi:hypothetical protein
VSGYVIIAGYLVVIWAAWPWGIALAAAHVLVLLLTVPRK